MYDVHIVVVLKAIFYRVYSIGFCRYLLLDLSFNISQGCNCNCNFSGLRFLFLNIFFFLNGSGREYISDLGNGLMISILIIFSFAQSVTANFLF